MDTHTLVINGKPLTFCMPPDVPVPRKGRCPGKGGAVKKAVKKAVAKKAEPKAPGKKPSAREAAIASLKESAREITSKPEHLGKPMKQVIGQFRELGKAPGRTFDEDVMQLKWKHKNGSGTVWMRPQGFRAEVHRKEAGRDASQMFTDLAEAAAWVDSRLEHRGH